MGDKSSLWRKLKRSSFDSVAVNMRTGTLTSPNEIVPRQIDRVAMATCSPARAGRKRSGLDSRGRARGAEETSLLVGGPHSGPGRFPASRHKGSGENTVDTVE